MGEGTQRQPDSAQTRTAPVLKRDPPQAWSMQAARIAYKMMRAAEDEPGMLIFQSVSGMDLADKNRICTTELNDLRLLPITGVRENAIMKTGAWILVGELGTAVVSEGL